MSDNSKNQNKSVLLGAAFLMATSAIGPGFLTQTAVFTGQLGATFGFVILASLILSSIAQINVWRVIGVSGLRGQEVANKVLPGLGYFVAALVAAGGLAFNIGNVGGAAQGLQIITGIDLKIAAALSCALAVFIFLSKEAGNTMDKLTKVLGALMILLSIYVAISSKPPVGEAVYRTFIPESMPILAIITLVGGTVGGYITFSGGHRLLDAGISGQENIKAITTSAVQGLVIAAIMRVLIFLAVLGVTSTGFTLDPASPPASAFREAAGQIGYRFFGVVMFAAAASSIVGAAYTSVSFIKTFTNKISDNVNKWIIGFIVLSTLVFITIGQPAKILVIVGSLNGLILPITLGVMLVASQKTEIVGDYKHPKWLLILGILVVIITAFLGFRSLTGIKALWS